MEITFILRNALCCWAKECTALRGMPRNFQPQQLNCSSKCFFEERKKKRKQEVSNPISLYFTMLSLEKFKKLLTLVGPTSTHHSNAPWRRSEQSLSGSMQSNLGKFLRIRLVAKADLLNSYFITTAFPDQQLMASMTEKGSTLKATYRWNDRINWNNI